MIYKFGSDDIYQFKFEAGKSPSNQDLMFQSRNVETEVNHQVAVIVIWHMRQNKGNDGKKDKDKYKGT